MFPKYGLMFQSRQVLRDFRLTTRDISDYDVLMKGRLKLLKQHNLTLQDVQNVISRLEPLPGAIEFVDWLRSYAQLIVVSDTFREFADPLMRQLGQAHSAVPSPYH